jgi:hypothetical protein
MEKIVSRRVRQKRQEKEKVFSAFLALCESAQQYAINFLRVLCERQEEKNNNNKKRLSFDK